MPPPAPDAPLAADNAPWQVRLLGAVQVDGPTGVVTRWPSRAIAALLARLVLQPHRVHPREELVELLWPGAPLDVGRGRLRQALSVLRGMLEPASGLHPTLLVADRQNLRLNAQAVGCDVLRLEQLLASGQHEAARQLAVGELMPGFYDEWILLERQRLANLVERLLPAVAAPAPAAATTAPATAHPATAGTAPTPLAGRLPAYWTRAFGQEESLSALCASVREHRLVTLVGPGGNGKTRLAVAGARALAAAQAAGGFDSVVFAPMFDVVRPEQLWPTLAWQLAATGGGDARSQVMALLARQATLLVLDNVEQFDAEAAACLATLLQDTPLLHLLVTSRRRLGLPGEQVHELPGLALPPLLPQVPEPLADAALLQALQHSPAVSLFVDRARESRPEFRLGAQNAAAVAGLVHLLGGMPLAIELAASRLRALGPRELLARLSADAGTPLLDLLARPGATGGRQTAASRHASMRHVVAWSWQQLRPELASLLEAMSVFAQPASPELIAQAWGGLPGAPEGERVAQVQVMLADALESSLVTRHIPADTPTPDDAPARYALLQPVREFAAERYGAAQAAAARTRVRRWLIGFARRCAEQRHAAIAEVQAEMPQICAAIMGGVADGACTEAAELAVALRRHWEIDTRAAPPMAVVQALREAQPHLADADLQCQTGVLLCISLMLGGDMAGARACADQALAVAPTPKLRAQALMRLAGMLLFSEPGTLSLDDTLAEALALARQVGDVETEAQATRLRFLQLCNKEGNYAQAEQVAGQMQALWESLGHRRNATLCLMDRASCLTLRGQHAQAAPPLALCEQVAREEHFPTGYIMASWQLGRALLKLRRADEALAAFRRCVRDSWQEQRMAYVADALVLVPGGLALCGHLDTAALLQGFATAHWQRHFGSFYRELERDVCFTRRVLRQRLGPARLETLRLQGSGLGLAQAVGLALANP